MPSVATILQKMRNNPKNIAFRDLIKVSKAYLENRVFTDLITFSRHLGLAIRWLTYKRAEMDLLSHIRCVRY